MKQTLYIFTISILLTSCATVITRRSYKMKITSNAENARVKISDSIYHLPATVKIKRSKNDLAIKLITDTANFNYTIKSSINPAFLFGNLLWMQVSPAAYLLDLTNQKRFYYGKSVFLNTSDTVRLIRPPVSKSIHNYFSKTYATSKGEIDVCISLPHINSFNLKPANEKTKINTGFWGIRFGLDYYYQKNKCLNVGIAGVSDFFFPLPAAVDISGEYELMSSKYISVSNNHKINRFTIGYGLSYAKNTWDFRYYERFSSTPPIREPVIKSSNAFGLIFPIYYQVGKNFHIGVVYRPTFYRPGITNKFKYEHLASIDFAWKIRLKKGKI